MPQSTGYKIKSKNIYAKYYMMRGGILMNSS